MRWQHLPVEAGRKGYLFHNLNNLRPHFTVLYRDLICIQPLDAGYPVGGYSPMPFLCANYAVEVKPSWRIEVEERDVWSPQYGEKETGRLVYLLVSCEDGCLWLINYLPHPTHRRPGQGAVRRAAGPQGILCLGAPLRTSTPG
jgi:hypothetical protein